MGGDTKSNVKADDSHDTENEKTVCNDREKPKKHTPSPLLLLILLLSLAFILSLSFQMYGARKVILAPQNVTSTTLQSYPFVDGVSELNHNYLVFFASSPKGVNVRQEMLCGDGECFTYAFHHPSPVSYSWLVLGFLSRFNEDGNALHLNTAERFFYEWDSLCNLSVSCEPNKDVYRCSEIDLFPLLTAYDVHPDDRILSRSILLGNCGLNTDLTGILPIDSVHALGLFKLGNTLRSVKPSNSAVNPSAYIKSAGEKLVQIESSKLNSSFSFNVGGREFYQYECMLMAAYAEGYVATGNSNYLQSVNNFFSDLRFKDTISRNPGYFTSSELLFCLYAVIRLENYSTEYSGLRESILMEIRDYRLDSKDKPLYTGDDSIVSYHAENGSCFVLNNRFIQNQKDVSDTSFYLYFKDGVGQ